MEVRAYESTENLFSTDYIPDQSCILVDSDNNQPFCVSDRTNTICLHVVNPNDI